MCEPISDNTRGYVDTESHPRRYYIGEMGISAVNMTQVLHLLEKQVRQRVPAYICAANVEAVVLAQRDADFRIIQNRSLLTLPDGMPLVWYARIAGESGVERVTGPDLLIELLKMSSRHGFTHYFYGDTQDTLVTIAQIVKDCFPGAVIKGMQSPPFRRLRDDEFHAAVEEINRLQPSFVWVALGCPKQEKWMAQAIPHIESGVLVGVGAAFKFLIGHYRHPAKIFQLAGLEGVFWRALRYPLYNVKWYSYHIPIWGLFLLKALIKRALRLGSR